MTDFGSYRNSQNDPRFNLIRIISNGSFAYVFEGEDCETKEKVAIKRIVRVNRDLGRQYEILSAIRDCQNIVKIKDIFFTRKQTRVVQNVIFQFIDDNLEDLIERTNKEKKRIPQMKVKSYIYQLLNGVHQLHSRKIAHRDLKPQNVLLTKNGKIRICDFGHSKFMDENARNTPFVVSRVYRAPELLLCITKYEFAIDIWAVGCILAELFILKPLFDGNTEGNQLFKILRFLGSFNAQQKKEIESRIPFDKSLMKSMGPFPRQNLKQFFRMVEDIDNFIDLLLKLFKYIPEKRITAKEAMEHPFFNNVRKDVEKERYEEESFTKT